MTLHFLRSAGGAEMNLVVVRGNHIVAIEVQAGLSRKLERHGYAETLPDGTCSMRGSRVYFTE